MAILPDGLYDRLVDDRLSAELSLLVQTNQAILSGLTAEERSARLAEAFVKILAGILDEVEPDDAGTGSSPVLVDTWFIESAVQTSLVSLVRFSDTFNLEFCRF